MDDLNSLAKEVGLTSSNQPSLQDVINEVGQSSANPWDNFKHSAQNIIAQKGLPNAVLPVLLSQAADESARGTAAPGNNYFGIKGQGNAGSNNLATQEFENGSYQNENSGFAAYNSPEDSINAYLNLIMKYPGVPEAIQSGDKDKIIKAIQANGYATSPTYVNTIESMPEFGGNYGSN